MPQGAAPDSQACLKIFRGKQHRSTSVGHCANSRSSAFQHEVILHSFGLYHLLKAGFLVVAVIKSKYYAKINVEQKTRLVVSNLTLRVWDVVESPTDTHVPLVSNYGYLRTK